MQIHCGNFVCVKFFVHKFLRDSQCFLRWLVSVVRFRVLFFKMFGRFALEPRFLYEKNRTPILTQKKFRLFCVNKVVLYLLTKEPHFLTKATGIFSTPKYSDFFYLHKKRESLLYSKRKFPFFA